MLLDRCNRKASAGKLARYSATDDASPAYDTSVEHLSGKSVKMPSTPRPQNLEISAGSLTVQT